jgi:HD-GYP domain-containing protein (c-di-GMP phosphodiesterase class II)
MPALNPDIAVFVSLAPTGSALRASIAELVAASGLGMLEGDADAHHGAAPLFWILDRSADPEVPLPLLRGSPVSPADVILVAEAPDPSFFDSITPAEIEQRLPFALGNLARQSQLAHQVRQEEEAVTILNEIGHALSAIPERDALLHAVLFQTRRVVKADGGSLYLVTDDGQLYFGAAQNDTVDFELVANTIPIDDSSLAGYVASRGIVQVIDDAYELPPDAPYSFNTGFDQRSGYCTRTMLTVPMRDRQGRVIAVVSLINRKPQFGVPLTSFDDVEHFSRRDVALVRSIAAQAAVALENHRLYEDIRRLFDGFVEAAVTGIEARDPATGGHSHRVAALTVALARGVNASKAPTFAGVHFTHEDLTELHYAALLHDFGKVGVREEVLLKAEKLYPWELDVLEGRFRHYATQVRLSDPDPSSSGPLLAEIRAAVGALRQLNRPGSRMEGPAAELIQRAATEWLLDDDGTPVVLPRDLERLSMMKGSLSDDEREEINAHVEHTQQFLQRIPWTPNLQGIPDLAVAHHERMDGSGYPRGISADEIPVGAKLMAICDVFDALTAGDRPYRSAMSIERGLWILQLEAKANKLCAASVQLFIDERIWAGITPGT